MVGEDTGVLANQRAALYLQCSIQTFLTNLVTTLQLTP